MRGPGRARTTLTRRGGWLLGCGAVLLVVGVNGTGKTTTVEILEGLRRRDGGEVRVLGADPATGDRRWRARLGVVGQTTGAGNALTVRETLDHFAAYHARPEDTDELIAAVGLTEAAGTRAARLSGGQRRRVELARILFSDAETMILDEPTNHLDADSVVWLREFLKNYKGGLIVISHDVELVGETVNRVFYLDANRQVIDVYHV